jgi:predicted nucleic acid-binding protein
MTILLDTNILTRGAQPGHVMYPAALNSVEILTKRGESLLLCSQNLYEFWSVATRPAGENGLGLTVARAHGELQSIQSIFKILPESNAVLQEWQRLVTQYEVKGRRTHDARLVATVITHGISTILTFNYRDFVQFSEIQVLDPASVVAAPQQPPRQP